MAEPGVRAVSRRVASAAVQAARTAVERALVDVPAGSCILVACSGGPDSLALAGTAAWVAPRRGLDVRAVVVDHGLQPGSQAIAADAVAACRSLGVAESESVHVTVGTDGGPEAAARDARYAALAVAAQRWSAVAVLLGHTRDDQAETVLLRLARGSGARSLAAMRPSQGIWLRPFLALPRHDVHDVAAELLRPLGLTPWSDPHNDDPSYARVRVRALMGALGEAVGPGAALGLSRSADLLRDDADALDDLASAEYDRLVATERDSVSADCGLLADLPRALRTRVLRLMGLRVGCPAEHYGSVHVGQVGALVTDWHGQGDLPLPGRVTARRECGRLWLLRS